MRFIVPGLASCVAVHAFAQAPTLEEIVVTADFRERAAAALATNVTVLDAATLDRPLADSDPDTARLVERYVRSMVGERLSTQTGQVRELIHVLLPRGECRVDRVAELLGVDRRTVHRRLAAEGETFRGLLEAVRRDLASAYLDAGSHSKTEVAQFLGFANLSSFSRWRRKHPVDSR